MVTRVGSNKFNINNTFSLIVAATPENGIGKNGTLSWDLPLDLHISRKLQLFSNQSTHIHWTKMSLLWVEKHY